MITLPDLLSDSPEQPLSSRLQICSQCQRAFGCGVASGHNECWCFMLPHIIPLDDKGTGSASGCLCPTCLTTVIEQTAAQYPL